MKFLLSAFATMSLFSSAFAQDPATTTPLDCGANYLVEIMIKFTAAIANDNYITLRNVCTREPIRSISTGEIGVGDNYFNLCVGPLTWVELDFHDIQSSTMGEAADMLMVSVDGVPEQTEEDLEDNSSVGLNVGPQTCDATADADPHFKTWSGKMFDFHGQCDLVLLQHPEFNNGQGLDIHARTQIRYQYSFIQTAAVQIGEDTMELTGFGEYSINGVTSAQLPTTLGGQFVVNKIDHAHNDDKNTHMYEIVIPEKGSIVLKSFKDMVGVSVPIILAGDFKDVAGVMGSSQIVDFQARDGSVMDDSEAFAFEWQVRDTDPKIFTNMNHKPQWPEKCAMPTISTEERRRLGEQVISYETAKKACEVAGRVSDIEMCIYDVIATSDLELANAGAF